MKNFTLTKRLAGTALSLSLVFGLSAQEFPVFRLAPTNPDLTDRELVHMDSQFKGVFPDFYRSRPSFGDYNNDGQLDILYGGQTHGEDAVFEAEYDGEIKPLNLGWNTGSFLMKNLGGGSDFERFGQHWYGDRAEWGGEYSYVYEALFTSRSGIYKNTYSNSVFFDYDNDGFLDVIVQATGEWGMDDFSGGGFTHVYRNLGPDGDYLYEWDEEAYIQWANDGNEKRTFESIAIGDLNKDGYLDIAVIGKNKNRTDDNGNVLEIYNGWEGRFVKVYLNNPEGKYGPERFVEVTDVELAEPAVYNGDVGRDYFSTDPSSPDRWVGFHPMSKGGIKFADLDNDGWLDIICTGWIDGKPKASETSGFVPEDWWPEMEGGQRTKIYKNMGDGSFREVSSTDPYHPLQCYDGELIIADFDNDGLLDIFLTGSRPEGETASIFYNRGNFEFEEASWSQLRLAAIHGGDEGNVVVADLNNDGLLDIITTGNTHNATFPAGEGYAVNLFYQNENGRFSHDTSYPLLNVQTGGIALGDINGDNTLDVFIAGYIGGDNSRFGITEENKVADCYAALFINDVEASGINANQAPSAPAGISVAYDAESSKLAISWGNSKDDNTPDESLIYNISVKNTVTGKTFMMIPAHLEGELEGRLKAVNYVYTGVRGNSYEMYMDITDQELTTGVYEVAVQAIDQAYAGSKFTKRTLTPDGITSNGNVVEVLIKTTDEGIFVETEGNDPVVIRDLSGRTVAQGVVNTTIPVAGNGVYLVTVGASTYKIAK